jgi:AcrR family transcriptional regulator
MAQSSSSPRTKPAEQRRTELLDAAESLIAEAGVDKLTVDAITGRAGVAKGTYYLHFSTKDDVVQALRDRLADEILAGHQAALAQLDAASHVARLDRWIADAINGRVERSELRDALFHRHRPSGSMHASSGGGAHVALLQELLEAGAADGTFAIPDIRTTAILLYGAVHGGVDALLDDHGDAATARLVAATQELARRAAGVRG